MKPGASLTELKKAYKRKALLLHPDINSSPNAEDEFIQLKLAYEYLSNPRRKITSKTTKKTSYQNKKQTYHRYEVKQQKLKQKAQNKRNYKKEIEYFDWYIFFRDMIRLGKGMLLFSLCSTAVVTLFSCFSGIRAILNSILVVNMFFGIFCVLIFTVFFLSYIPDILRSITFKNNSRTKK